MNINQAKQIIGKQYHAQIDAKYCEAQAKPKRSKYGNVRTERDGIVFDSKLEAMWYERLKMMKAAGEIVSFSRQQSFSLIDVACYKVDFTVVYPGRTEYWDIKSKATAKDKTYRLKKKLVEKLYGIEILEKYR